MEPSNQSNSLINIGTTETFNYVPVTCSKSNTVEGTSYTPLRKVENVKESKSVSDFVNKDDSKPKFRKRNPDNWKQNIRKHNKNKGLEYVKANGEVCEKKKLGPPCSCKENCYSKIGIDACEKIFRNFWKLGDYALQNAYVGGCVRIFLPKHCYKKEGVPSRRFFSRNFHVTVNGVDTEVCKQAFLNMHAISNGRLDRLLKKKQEIGNTGFDERGRHSNKVNKIPIEKIRLVRKHIDSVRQKAGYSGKRKPKKVEILPNLLNIRTMYRSYREEILLKGLEPVCEYRYRKIFHTDFHLNFGKTSRTNEITTKSPVIQKQPQDVLSIPSPIINEVNRDKLVDKYCDKTTINKKGEEFDSMTLSNMNMNLQVNASFKSNKPSFVVAQLGSQTKEYNSRLPDSNQYIYSQEVFQLDYSSGYSSPQQNWIFSNPS